MTDGLLALRDWLCAHQVRVVGIQSTGTWWKPVYSLPARGPARVLAAGAHHLRNVPAARPRAAMRPGSASWSSTAWSAPASCRPDRSASCATSPATARWSSRSAPTRSSASGKVLEDAGTRAVVGGHRHPGGVRPGDASRPHRGQLGPRRQAWLAKGRLRVKLPELRAALRGHFDRHHGLLAAEMLARIDTADATIGRLSEEIDRVIAPYAGALALLETIPGVARRTAEVIVAETGTDMQRFPSRGRTRVASRALWRSAAAMLQSPWARRMPMAGVAQADHRAGGVAGPCLGGVLDEGDIADVLQRLDPPVAAHVVGQAGQAGLGVGEAGDRIHRHGPPPAAGKRPDPPGDAHAAPGWRGGSPGPRRW
jgi:hypothetical protein